MRSIVLFIDFTSMSDRKYRDDITFFFYQKSIISYTYTMSSREEIDHRLSMSLEEF